MKRGRCGHPAYTCTESARSQSHTITCHPAARTFLPLHQQSSFSIFSTRRDARPIYIPTLYIYIYIYIYIFIVFVYQHINQFQE